MLKRTTVTGTVAATGAAALAFAAIGQPVRAAEERTPATYWMSAETGSGLGGNMAAALLGGDAGPTRDLTLQLAGNAPSASAASGDHAVPPALRAGASLPLVPPAGENTATERDDTVRRTLPSEMKAQMRVYWGCGDVPASGSPRTLDMRNPGATFAGATVRSMMPPSATNRAGYGEWPNRKSRAQLKSASSMVGDHVVRSNFAPEIRFALAADQDFLAPITLAQRSTGAGGLALTWPGVDRATGYFISIMGTAADGTAIVWTSSQVPLQTLLIDEFLDPAEVARLTGLKAVLPADARSCTVPAEVMKAIETPMLTMNAFGQEVNLSEPKPATAPASWRPAWHVKLRRRAVARQLLGEAGAALSTMQTGGEADGGGTPAGRKKGGLLRSLGRGLLPGS